MLKVKKHFYKKKRGITLISLVVTIIVILLIAGVAFTTLTGENSLISKAQSAIKKNKQATALEEFSLAWTALQADYHSYWAVDTGVAFSSLVTVDNLNKYTGDAGTVNSVVNSGDGTYIIEYSVNNKEKDVYLFLVDEKGNMKLLDGLNVVPSNANLQVVRNEEGIVQNHIKLKAVLTDIEGIVNWSISGNTNAVSLSSTTGNEITVTPRTNGIVTITATVTTEEGNYTDNCVITLTESEAIITVGELNVENETLNINTATTITTPNLNPGAATEILSWESSNTAIAAITPSNDGKSATIAGIGVGNATITAKAANGNSSSIDITVVDRVKVKFMANGIEHYSTEIERGEKILEENWPTDPTKTDFTFKGWYDSEVGGTQYTTSTEINDIITLYAKWQGEGYLGAAINIDKYGMRVKGYKSANYSGIWRLFYQDEDNTYIIAELTNTKYKPSSYYSSYTSGASVSTEGQNLNYKLKINGGFVSTNKNNGIKAIAWMTDTRSTSTWSTTYKDAGGMASYAIGSPTIELYVESYKATHPSSQAAITASSYEYTPKGMDSGLNTPDNYGIYGTKSWWLASPRRFNL